MRIHYYTAPCGAGKSYQAAQRMIDTPGRYLVVRDRVEAIQEYANQLTVMSMQRGNPIPIATITADNGKAVRIRVEDAPNTFDSLTHCIVLVTHKAMMMADFTGYAGWHIIIDETPVVLDRQDLQTSQSVDFFTRHYDLKALNESWSAVTLSREGWTMTPADLENDDCFRLLRVFHERVTSASELPEDATVQESRRAAKVPSAQRAVIGNLRDWQDMADGRRWSWWSLWSPRQLEPFATITFMANGFDKSVSFRLLRALHPEIDWCEVTMASQRVFAPRKIVIRHFAQNHVASQSLFASDQGADYLERIAAFLRGHDQIWMANDRQADALRGIGTQLRPHQAGSNQYASYNAATAIYAAKPSAESRSILNALGVESDVWTASYEHEAILQFMCRTSVRNPLCSATVVLTVYDREQADYLSSYFSDQRHCHVERELIDLGFARVKRTVGAPVRVLTSEEAEARKARRRESNAAAAKRARAKKKVVA